MASIHTFFSREIAKTSGKRDSVKSLIAHAAIRRYDSPPSLIVFFASARSDPRGATIELRTLAVRCRVTAWRDNLSPTLRILLFRRATCGEETVARETRARRLQSRCCTRGVTERDTLHRRLFAILGRGINSREASRNNKRGPRSISIPLSPTTVVSSAAASRFNAIFEIPCHKV